MSNALRLIAILVMACAGLAACGSQQPAPHGAPGPSSTTSSATSGATVWQSTPSHATVSPTDTSTPTCMGLSICPPPPPDAEGNPPCYYADGWRANDSGAGIEVWYFHEPQNLSKPDNITVVVRKKDGTSESRDASIEAGQQVHRFEFATIGQTSVEEVLLTTSTGRCFVIGPGS